MQEFKSVVCLAGCLKVFFRYCCFTFFWILMSMSSASAATLPNASVSVDDLTVGAIATYTVSFTPVSQLDNTAIVPDVMAIQTVVGGPDFSAAVLQSVSGGTITAAIATATQSSTLVNINITGGVATSADTVTFVLSNVLNPGSVGLGPDYTVRTVDFSAFPPAPIIDDAIVVGNVYTPSNEPVVVNPIMDQNLNQEDGPTVVVTDLNDVFADADGVLSFSVGAITDTNVASASIDGSDALTITPNGSGNTSITINASSGGQSTFDTFEVQVIGQLSGLTITPQDLDAGASTAYDLTFSPSNQLLAGEVIVINTGTTGPDYTNATLVSLSGGSVVGIFGSHNNQTIAIEITAGSANSTDTIAIQLGNVLNPGAAGQGPDYLVRTIQLIPAQDKDRATVPGSIYVAVGTPTVVTPIADQNLDEVNGQSQIIADLNTVFIDGDGDPLTFSVEAGNDVNVATATVMNDALFVTPTGPGSTTITVKASDLPLGEGEVTTSFEVAVVGLMDNASWAPQNFDSNAVTSYDMSFTPSSTVVTDQLIIINNVAAGGPDYSTATLGMISGGNLTATLNSQSDTTISFEITGGTAAPGETVLLVVNGVTNPNLGGLGPDYQLRLFNLIPTGDVERVTLSGSNFIDVGLPVVSTPIADLVLDEVDGTTVIEGDLNNVFVDGNGQSLVFTVLPGNDVEVATAAINVNELSVTPVGSGSTTIMVQASDLDDGGTGTVIDSFVVRVVGELDNASIMPNSLEVSEATSYEVAFNPAGDIVAGDVIEISTMADGPDFSLANLDSFVGGSMTANLISQNPLGLRIEIITGSASSTDLVDLTLSPVINPSVEGQAPDYLLAVVDDVTVLDRVRLAGNSYVDTDLIFESGFELILFDPNVLAKSYLNMIPYTAVNHDHFPFFNSTTQQYQFLGEVLSRDYVKGEMRDGLAVIRWLENVLLTRSNLGDWDEDGWLNWQDDNPFGIQ